MDLGPEHDPTLALYGARGHFAVVLVHRNGVELLQFAQDAAGAVAALRRIAEAAAAGGIALRVEHDPVELLAA